MKQSESNRRESVKLEDINEELSEETLHRLYLQTIYAMSKLSEEDLSMSTENCKEFLRTAHYGFSVYATLHGLIT